MSNNWVIYDWKDAPRVLGGGDTVVFHNQKTRLYGVIRLPTSGTADRFVQLLMEVLLRVGDNCTDVSLEPIISRIERDALADEHGNE